MNSQFALSFITDEISQDFEEALRIAKQFGIQAVELRTIWNKNIVLFSDAELKKLKTLLDQYNIKISVISGPFAKSVLPSSKFSTEKKNSFSRNPAYNLSLFNRLIEIATFFDTKFIRIFNFFKLGKITQPKWNEMVSLLQPFIKQAENQHFTLLLENEHVCFADNVENTARFLDQINSPALKLNLDPGNFYSMKEQTTPDAYDIFYENDWVAHMHIKDPKFYIPRIGGIFGIVGQGKINYDSLIQQAVEYEYSGYFTLETHCHKNKKEISIKSLKYLSQLPIFKV